MWYHGYERLFVIVKKGEFIGYVLGNLYQPDFIKWQKADALGIRVITASSLVAPMEERHA